MASASVIASIHDGMGNQMFQYAMAKALADRLGARLLLDLSAFAHEPPRPYALSHFAIRAGSASADEIRALRPESLLSRAARAAGLRPRQRPRVNTPTYFYETKFYHYDPQVESLRAPIYLDGFWQSARYFERIKSELAEDFAIASPIDPGNVALLERVRSVEAICVHVRRGDYQTDAIFHLLPLSYYEQAAELMRERVRAPVFVVFSDEPAWAHEHLRLPGEVIWTFDHGQRSAIEDMRLMLACKHFVIANSTFSWWPAFLSQHPTKVVVRPTRWFTNETWDADELREDSWISL
jgi:hypothetical protein